MTLTDERRLHGQARGTIQALLSQVDDLRRELEKLNAALEASEVKAREQNVQIVDLGNRLNQALASRVQELQRYRSEFFGRLRELLADRPDIEIVGDRFVFPSEVLFPVGSPDLEVNARPRKDLHGPECVERGATQGGHVAQRRVDRARLFLGEHDEHFGRHRLSARRAGRGQGEGRHERRARDQTAPPPFGEPPLDR